MLFPSLVGLPDLGSRTQHHLGGRQCHSERCAPSANAPILPACFLNYSAMAYRCPFVLFCSVLESLLAVAYAPALRSPKHADGGFSARQHPVPHPGAPSRYSTSSPDGRACASAAARSVARRASPRRTPEGPHAGDQRAASDAERQNCPRRGPRRGCGGRTCVVDRYAEHDNSADDSGIPRS